MDLEQRMYAANLAVRSYPFRTGADPEWQRLVEEAHHLRRKWEIKRRRAAHCPHCGRPFADSLNT